MKVVFKNPITEKFEVGLIFKKYLVNGNVKYDLVSEKGNIYLSLSEDTKKKGYVDLKLTENVIYSIETNLTKETQANYKYSYVPSILKFSI